MLFFIRLLLLSVLPTLLIYYGTDKIKLPWDNQSVVFAYFRTGALVLGTIVALLVVPYRSERDKRKLLKLSNAVKTLLSALRKSVDNELAKSFLQYQPGHGLKLSIRIFVPNRRSLADLWKGRRYFEITNIEGIYTREVDNLKFQVYPEKDSQGLVGQAYREKSIKYDFELSLNRSNEFYRLQPHQIEKIAYCCFAIAVPIFKATSQKIAAIITFDSEVKVVEPIDGNWTDTIRKASAIIHKTSDSIH